MLESHRLGQDDQLGVALANILGSLVIGFGAVAVGHAVGVAL
jgi:fluoride ion exporter CrcB/FEX